MKKRFLITMIAFGNIVFFVMTGCAANGPLWKPSQGIRNQYVEKHSALTAEIRQAILQGRVIVGMTREDVRASWGAPNSIRNSTNSQLYVGDGEGWHYKAFFLSLEPTRFVEFKEGIVVYFSENYK